MKTLKVILAGFVVIMFLGVVTGQAQDQCLIAGSDGGVDVALDSDGSIYVLATLTFGQSGVGLYTDILLIKYDSLGVKQWARRSDVSTLRQARATSLALDPGGNVFVLGSVEDMAVIIKYNREGEQLWAARPVYSPWSWPGGMALDAAGNAYITVNVESSQVTTKYDTNGNKLWQKTLPGLVRADSIYAQTIAVDSSGSVFVVGHNQYARTCVTAKYDTLGNQLWVASFDRGHDSELSLDASGNLYVATRHWVEENWCNEITLIKYPAAYAQGESPEWVAQYIPGSYGYRALAIFVDPLGNIFLTGNAPSGAGSNFLTLEYDAGGHLIWASQYNGPGSPGGMEYASDVAVDGSGNAYVTGISDGGPTSFDWATVKYSATGNQLWAERYDGPMVSYSYDFARALAVDSAGNAYVTGIRRQPNNWGECFTIKYDTCGVKLLEMAYKVPVACAGRDQVVVDNTCPRGFENVTLNGGGSTGEVSEYIWKERGVEIAKGISPAVSLSLGYHYLELVVTDGFGDFTSDFVGVNVMPGSASAMVTSLISKVASFNLQQGIANSLDQKLQNAQKALEDVNQNNNASAWARLDAFRQECQAQSGKELTASQASELIGIATCIMVDWLQ